VALAPVTIPEAAQEVAEEVVAVFLPLIRAEATTTVSSEQRLGSWKRLASSLMR
jgi:hypothetical protein